MYYRLLKIILRKLILILFQFKCLCKETTNYTNGRILQGFTIET